MEVQGTLQSTYKSCIKIQSRSQRVIKPICKNNSM